MNFSITELIVVPIQNELFIKANSIIHNFFRLFDGQGATTRGLL